MVEIRFDLEKAVELINKEKAKRVVLQLPEGLKTKAVSMIEELEKKTDAEFVLMTDPLFGACDVNEEFLLKTFDAQMIVHFGHNEFLSGHKKVLFLPGSYAIPSDFREVLEEVLERLESLKAKKIVLYSIIQFRDFMDAAEKFFEEKGIACLLLKGKRTVEGQSLGCDVFGLNDFKKDFDAIVFFGDGGFHSSAVAMSSNKKIVAVNPLTKEINEFENSKEAFVRKRMGMVSKAMNAMSFGLLVSTKKGQFRMQNALRLKKLIEEKGKKAFILADDVLLPEHLIGLGIDCFVNTACPRIIDDSFKFDKPLINPVELEISLGARKIKDYDFAGNF